MALWVIPALILGAIGNLLKATLPTVTPSAQQPPESISSSLDDDHYLSTQQTPQARWMPPEGFELVGPELSDRRALAYRWRSPSG
jgi:hypothetical protein